MKKLVHTIRLLKGIFTAGDRFAAAPQGTDRESII